MKKFPEVDQPPAGNQPTSLRSTPQRRQGPRQAPSRLWWSTRTGIGVKVAAIIVVITLLGTGTLLLRPAPALIRQPPTPAAFADGSDTSADHQPSSAAADEDSEELAHSDNSDDAQADASPADADEVVVHVAGAVADPGLVQLEPSARIADAITAAGGAEAEADLDGVNLAAPAQDSEQIYVPAEGESPPAMPSETAEELTGPVNLNTADAATLETLPGVGPVTAGDIISWREEHGEFQDVSELTQVAGIGPATMANLEDDVTI